jgi:hypothetical protein
MFHFRISTVLLVFLAVAITVAWCVDHRRLVDRIERVNPPISLYGEKFGYWSPSLYLNGDTSLFELVLPSHIHFDGELVKSSQGMGRVHLRQPTIETLDATISLLDRDDEEVKLIAIRLLALYLQAVSGRHDFDAQSVATRVHFQVNGLHKVRYLLQSSNPDIRSAAALTLGNSLYDRDTLEMMEETFEKEKDSGVKQHLAWAYWSIGHNYHGAKPDASRFNAG